jgi:hypothetical protein
VTRSKGLVSHCSLRAVLQVFSAALQRGVHVPVSRLDPVEVDEEDADAAELLALDDPRPVSSRFQAKRVREREEPWNTTALLQLSPGERLCGWSN